MTSISNNPVFRKLIIGTSIAGIVALGFLREFLFVNINEQLFSLWYDEPSRASDAIPFLKDVDYYTLYGSKWLLTPLFAIFFYFATGSILRLLFGNAHWKLLIVIFASMIGAAALAMGVGYFTNQLESAYTLARFLMGILQSPLILMLLIPGIYLKGKRTS